MVRVEDDAADVDALGGDVLLLELTGLMALHEGRLTDSSIAYEHDLEFSNGHDLFGLSKDGVYLHFNFCF